MLKRKILLVFGTRPEAIKMIPLVRKLRENDGDFVTEICVTGQHREMLHQVLDLFDVTPDYDLDIMQPGQDLYDVTARVLTGMRDVLAKSCPDFVLVHGDTSTSTAAALAAFYARIPVGHVEAGLRTGDVLNPWPEEMNRRLTGRIASLHFAPTRRAALNLREELVDDKDIVVTGNTVIDCLMDTVAMIDGKPGFSFRIASEIKTNGYDVGRLTESRKMILVTGHRRENFGDGFIRICHALKDIARKYPDVDIVYPMHLNPNVRRPIQEIFPGAGLPNVFFIEPLQYLQFVFLMSASYLILTDSGGIQEEAPSLGKPVLVMREVTERPEALEAGTVHLVGTDKEKIVAKVSELIDNESYYTSHSLITNPYGDGHASERIVDGLKRFFERHD